MNRDQYFEKHKLLNIAQIEMERKWKAHLYERLMMEQQVFGAQGSAGGAASNFLMTEDGSPLETENEQNILV